MIAALSGCGQTPGGQDDRICLNITNNVDGPMSRCIHKWAYRLAVSNDPAEAVAKAVEQACTSTAFDAANEAAAAPEVQAAGDPKEVFSEAYKANLEYGQNNSLFRVVQARAGHCEVVD